MGPLLVEHPDPSMSQLLQFSESFLGFLGIWMRANLMAASHGPGPLKNRPVGKRGAKNYVMNQPANSPQP